MGYSKQYCFDSVRVRSFVCSLRAGKSVKAVREEEVKMRG